MIGAKSRDRLHSDISLAALLSLTTGPMARWFMRRVLRARLRSLQGLADYFEWQEKNGRAGLADTHKRMAVAKASLNELG